MLAHSVPISKKINRGLLTYAFVSQRLTRTSDYIQSLVPLFVPIIEDMNGEFFDSKKFSEKLFGLYGLTINEDVVEEVVPRLVKEKLLEKVNRSSSGDIYICRSGQEFNDYVDEYDLFNKKLHTVLEQFVKFVQEEIKTLQSINYTKEQLEEILIEWLVYSDTDVSYASNILNGDSEYHTSAKQLKIRSDEEYLCARFAKKLEKEDVTLFNELSLIASGAMVSEVVLHIRRPYEQKYKFEDLNVYLDGPMLMSFFALAGTQKKENTEYIVHSLQRLGCRIRVFQHSLEEAREAVRCTLSLPRGSRRGPLADAIRSNDITEDYAKQVAVNLDELCSQNNIQIADASVMVTTNESGYFGEEQTREFISKLSAWQNITARDRDALSLQTIMCKRRGHKSKDFFKLKHCMITSNPALFNISQRFCLTHGLILENQIGPFVHVRRVSAILFLLLGAKERAELSRRQLLANCSRSLVANPAVIEAMREKLRSIRPELSKQFEQLMNIPHYVQLSMDLSLGHENVINSESPEKIVSILKEEFANDAESKADEKYRKIINQNKRGLAKTKEEVSKLENEIVVANDRLEQNVSDEVRMFSAWLSLCRKIASFAEVFVKLVLTSIVCYYSYVSQFRDPGAIGDAVLWISGAGGVILSIWVSGSKLKSRFNNFLVRQLFQQFVKISNKSDKLSLFNIDYSQGTIDLNKVADAKEGQLL